MSVGNKTQQWAATAGDIMSSSGAAKLVSVTSNPTPATGKALRAVFNLLEDNFDGDEGVYRNEYDDARVAKETGISVDAVKNYRTSAFGKLKPPSEFYKMQQEIGELERLYIQTDQAMKEGLKDLKARMAIMQRKFD